MKPLSIRAGLSLRFAGLALLLLVAFAVTLFWSSGRALRAGLDGRLATTAAGLAQLSDWDEDAGFAEFELAEEFAERFAASHAVGSQEVWTWPEMRLLYLAGETPDRPLPEAAWGAGFDPAQGPREEFLTLAGADGPLRVCTALIHVPAPRQQPGERAKKSFTVLVRVAEDYRPVAAQLGRLGWLIGGSAVVAAALAALFSIYLSKRVVRPLRELGDAASAVRAGRLAPMPRRRAGDEVDALADHLDHAFGRLEEALQRQARFTADAAHELRNPVSVIRNAAEVALRRERTPAEYQDFLRDVLETSSRMGGAIEALLLLARLDAEGVRRAFSAVDLAEIARDSARALPGARPQLRLPPDESPVMVRGDGGLLRVLVDNLLSNAARHSPEGAPVEVIVERNGCARLLVRDRGAGIAPEHRSRVFDRFYRADGASARGSGAGLGLAIVAEVARLHGATPHLETSAAGTTVSVEFPPSPA